MAERFLGKKEAGSSILPPGSVKINKYGNKKETIYKDEVLVLQKNQLLHSKNQSNGWGKIRIEKVLQMV